MLAIAQSSVLVGISSIPVRVEVQAERGIPTFELVGLAETAVRESRVRVKRALAGVGVDIGECHLTVNLAPADVKKSGSSFDLAIALAILVALGRLPADAITGVVLLGELSLNGGIQCLRGVVAHLMGAKARGMERAIVPLANEREASLIDGVDVELASTLAEVVEALGGKSLLARPKRAKARARTRTVDDLADVRGQYVARRALEIAASGAHNLLMVGPPGAGKTMLARRLSGILPSLSREEALEVLAIHGVAGTFEPTSNSEIERPFRAPHHTTSDVALVGGGEHSRPGEVSLAHHGVLFLDELTELRRSALEALRQPLEDGFVTVCRMRITATFPARPMLIGATNPCPCGSLGDGTERCTCAPDAVRNYRRRLSGPLLDRLDIHVVLPRVDLVDLESASGGEPSANVRERVERTRAIQRERFRSGEVSVQANAHLRQRDVQRVCALDDAGKVLLASAMKLRGLSARAYGKVLRVARTIADMEGTTAIASRHVGEALRGRVLDRDPGNGHSALSAEVA